MRILSGGCRVLDSADGETTVRGSWTEQTRIGPATGAQQITQALSHYAPGRSPALVNPNAEEVLYVVSGEGACFVDGFAYELRPGVGVYIPDGAEYLIDNPGPENIQIVSACCPYDPERLIRQTPILSALGDKPTRTVDEATRERLPATTGREFCLLVHTDLGCRQVTQFVGWIPQSAAPFHFHTYEEVLFVLSGRGILHVEDEDCDIFPGSSIYFPVRVKHCLENPQPEPMRLLGVFYPSGSPAAAYNK